MRRTRALLTDTVRDGILSAIHDGSLPVGAKLPPEPELCAAYQVSRTTIREAVRGLVEEGYLSRIHGSGTYVAFRPNIQHSLERNLSYTALIEGAGFRATRRVLDIRRREPSEVEVERLGLKGGLGVVVVERVRLADDRPVIYSIDVIPGSVVAEADDSELAGSLYDLFRRLGHRVNHGEATLAPVLADSDRSSALGVTVGSPLLHIAQVDFTSEGRPVMFSREWHAPGVFELTLLRRST